MKRITRAKKDYQVLVILFVIKLYVCKDISKISIKLSFIQFRSLESASYSKMSNPKTILNYFKKFRRKFCGKQPLKFEVK